jgi:hypothetical protein
MDLHFCNVCKWHRGRQINVAGYCIADVLWYGFMSCECLYGTGVFPVIHAPVLNNFVGICLEQLAGGMKQFGLKGGMNELSSAGDIRGETGEQGLHIRQVWKKLLPSRRGLRQM